MGMPRTAGRYWAMPLEWVCEKSRRSGLPEFKVKFSLTHVAEPGGWRQLAAPAEIVWYARLIKKDGTRNDFIIECLAKVFGWDTVSFDALNALEISAVQCQVEVKDWQSATTSGLEVAFVNHADYVPTRMNDRAPKSSLDTEFGAALRGGKVAVVPAARPAVGPGAGKLPTRPPDFVDTEKTVGPTAAVEEAPVKIPDEGEIPF